MCELVSVKEAAQVLDLAPRTIQRWIKQERLSIKGWTKINNRDAYLISLEEAKSVFGKKSSGKILDFHATSHATVHATSDATVHATSDATSDATLPATVMAQGQKEKPENTDVLSNTEDSGKVCKIANFEKAGYEIPKQPGSLEVIENKIKTLQNSRKETWISVQEAAYYLAISGSRVRHKAFDGEIAAKRVNTQGGWRYEIALSSLPEDAQNKYFSEQYKEGSKSLKEIYGVSDYDIPELERPEKPTISDKDKILSFYVHLKGQVKVDHICEILNSDYPELGLKKFRLFAWQRAFKKHGRKGLADKRGGNRRTIDDNVMRDVLMAHSAALKDTNLHIMYKIRFKMKHGEEAKISYEGFRKARRRLLREDTSLRIMHTKGLDGLYSNIGTIRRRDISRVNQEWQIDASPLDMMVLSPEIITPAHKNWKDGITYRKWSEYKYGKDTEWGIWADNYRVIFTPKRKTVVAIIDVYSGMRVWGLFDSANTNANVRLLRKALLKLGKPYVLRMDNGADYMSVQFQQALINLGIIKRIARPYKGKDKGAVERNFRTMFHGRMELLEGFIGHNVADRQLIENSTVLKQERLAGAKTNLKGLFTEEEAEMVLDRFIDLEAERLGWKAKYDYQADSVEFLPEDIINICIGKRHGRKVSRTGIRLNNSEFQSPELWRYQDSEVVVAEDIDNLSKVYVLSEEDELLCTVYNTEIRQFTVDEAKKMEKEHTKEINKLRRQAKKVRQEDKELVHKEFIGDLLEEERRRRKELYNKDAEEKVFNGEPDESEGISPLLWAQIEKGV